VNTVALCKCGCGTPTRTHNGVRCEWAHGHYQAFRSVGDKSRRQRARNIAWRIIRESLLRTISLTDASRTWAWIRRETDRLTEPLGVVFSDASIKNIWTRGCNSEFTPFRHHWKEVEINDKKKHQRRIMWNEKNPEKLREISRLSNRRNQHKHLLRFPKIRSDQMLVDRLVALDAPMCSDSGKSLHEALSADQLNPLELLMLKEEVLSNGF
jgi:hypothetical protein